MEPESKFIRNMLLGICIILLAGIIYNQMEKDKEGTKEVQIEEILIVSNEKENYYETEYYTDKDGLTIHINNICLEIMESDGNSMRPFWENESLAIVDTCFPLNQLEIGDIIIFEAEYLDQYVGHRITDINYEDKWVRTKGDNNDYIDDFKGFEYIVGKEIGVLNVVRDKK